MKRIMIAMGAVMSLALGAWAGGVATGSTIVNAMMFNGITSGTSITNGLEDSGYSGAVADTAYIGDGGVHWECAGSTEDSVITNQTGYAYGEYLQIDQTDTLYRWMEQTTSSTTNKVTSTQGIYFASKVQFTASDETNGVNLVSDASDKLLIWLRAADFDDDGNVDGTNLVITASSGFPGDPEKADFVISNFDVVPGTWYELLVKSDYYSKSGAQGILFTVKMAADGTTSEAAFTTLKTSDNVDTFYSMDGSGDDSATVTKVGFKGTGAVDNLEFGTYTVAAETYFRVGNTDYEKFSDALSAAGNGDTIEVTRDCLGLGTYQVLSGKNVVLDLAGHTISNGTTTIRNLGTLKITNSTETVGRIICGGNTSTSYAILSTGTLIIVGGKFYGKNGGDAVQRQAGTLEVYYISGDTAKESELEQVASGDDAGYWVIKEKSDPVQTQVTAYLSLDPVSATYNENKESQTPADYTTVTVVFSNDTAQVDVPSTEYTITWSADTVTNATSDYVCTVTAKEGSTYTFTEVTATLTMFQYVPTWDVTFSTNGTVVAEYTTNVVDKQSLTADKIPAFTGGKWDIDPTNAVITCATNFNYTISGSNWPAAWSDDSAYAAAYTSKLTTWMTNNNISSMDTLTVADETAFLLNIAPDAADKTIDATAITIDGTTVKITVDQELGSANGVVYLMYGSTPALGSVKTITFVDGEGDTPSSMTTLEGETATAQFYKVGVGFAAPVTAEP